MNRPTRTARASVCIIGAGVIGCAIARVLSADHFDVTVIDSHHKAGQGITSRNSEVIHAGMYYPTNSLKAKLCVEGRHQLYEYCQQHTLPHKKIGKFIIASSPDEVSQLEKIYLQAQANGISSLRLIDQAEIARCEPYIKAFAALSSPETGIVSAHDVCSSLETEAINHGASFAYHTLVTHIEKSASGWNVTTQQIDTKAGTTTSLRHPTLAPSCTLHPQPYTLQAEIVINSAGLYADWVSALAGVDPQKADCALTWVKGEYFSLSSSWSSRVSRLIYPVPEKHTRGLGVHVTIDMGGQVKLGPNVVEIDRVQDFAVDRAHRRDFYLAAKKYLPSLEETELSPAYAGIRPKLSKAGEPARDFIIREESSSGAKGFVNLVGIESPGLTSALAIAQYVRKLL